MSTIVDPKASRGLLPADDPFYYGWRDVWHQLPDGSQEHEMVPLTLADHLHPQGEEDCFMEGMMHNLLRDWLATVFRCRLSRHPTALVLSNTNIIWDDTRFPNHVPDVAVFFGVREPKRDRLSFDVAVEGTRPRLILELVSPRYRPNDVVKKFEQYHQARVPLYVILDREREGDPWTIRAYQRNPRSYLPIPLSDDGRLWLEDLNLWLAVDGQQIRCFDGDTDEEFGDYETMTRRAEEAKTRADSAEARLRELEAEIARLKGQSPP